MLFETLFSFNFLPFLIFAGVLLWTGFLLTGFFTSFPSDKLDRKVYLFIGLSCISFAVYTLVTGLFFATTLPILIYWAGLLKLGSMIFAATFMILLSVSYLKIKHAYWWKVFPLMSAVYLLLLVLFPGWMISYEVDVYEVSLGGHVFLESLPRQKLLAMSYSAFIAINALIVGCCWIGHYIKKRRDFYLIIAFFLVAASGILEHIHEARLYSFFSPFVFIIGFVLIGISFYLFRNVMKAHREFWKKSQELREINEEMRFLVSTISHDVMGPLVAIHGFADLMEEEELSEDLSEEKRDHYLERIRVNVEHMKNLLSDLADYVRIGRVEENIEVIDFPSLIGQTVAIMDIGQEFRDAKVEISGQWPREFYASGLRLKQLFMNLIQNSLRYAKRRDIRVVIRGKVRNDQFKFWVQDNGPGISKEVQEKVFDIFFRNDRGVQGTGMGLPIVRKIIQSFDGEVFIDPAYENGVSICVTLPYLEESVAQLSSLEPALYNSSQAQ